MKLTEIVNEAVVRTHGVWRRAEKMPEVYLKFVRLEGGAEFYNIYDPTDVYHRGKAFNLGANAVSLELGLLHTDVDASEGKRINKAFWEVLNRNKEF